MRGALAMVGDCRDLPLPDESVEAVVTDPPYGLSFMGREWDHDVPGPDYWREVKRVMKPGAHLLAFGGTRTWHWLTVGIEEAGFEIRDCLSWMYGTGFPKSHDIARAVDEKRGTEGEWRQEDHPGREGARVRKTPSNIGQTDYTEPDHRHVYQPGEAGERWDGWGTALKPGWEPVVLAMKPTDGTFAENALEHGVAGLNVDGCRLGTDEQHRDKCESVVGLDSNRNGSAYGEWSGERGNSHTPEGRWPANVTLSHTRWCVPRGTKRVAAEEMGSSGGDPDGHGIYNEGFPRGDGRKQDYADEDGTEEVEDWDCPPSCPVRQLDEQSGHLPGPANKNPSAHERENFVYGDDGAVTDRLDYIVDEGGGGASRFYYCSKASRREREAGLPDVDGRANQHPTVKPIDLCRWLVRLVTRKGHTVLDPFMGSGSIGCAALQERRRYIGLDLNPEYVEIARARLEHWYPKQVDLFKDRGAA